jgi:ubiquinone/menaquinone biosynthesis C-methylase UbiE
MRKIESDYEILSENIGNEDKTIIDVGCGTGDLVRWFASQNLNVTGIDVEEMLVKAKSFPKVNNEAYLIGIGQQLPFEDNFADVKTYIASFHHIPSHLMKQALNECYRVLKPQGKMILIEPVSLKNSYYEIIKLVEDEAEIQNYAYNVLVKSNEVNLKLLKEETFYLERSFQDYINLLNVFVDSDNERKEITEKARKKTQQLCEKSGIGFNDFLYKSVARLIVLEK